MSCGSGDICGCCENCGGGVRCNPGRWYLAVKGAIVFGDVILG